MSSPWGPRRVDTANGPKTTLALIALTFALPAAAGTAAPGPDDAADAHSVGRVTATATRAQREALDTAAQVTVIDRQAIEESGARNVPELLRRQAGLYVANTTSSRTGYVIEPRGFNNGSGGGSSVLVLVDGRRVNEPESSVPAWELLALDNIERIEIVTGPASALYGDNAVGGVIEIVTRRGEGAGSATLTGRLGEHRTKEGSLLAGGSAGPLSLQVFSDHFQSDGYRDQADFQIRQFQGRADLALGQRASLSLRGGYSSDDRQPPGALTEAEIDDDRRQVGPDSIGSTALVRSRFVDGVFEASPFEGTLVSLQGYYTRRDDATLAPSAAGEFARDFETQALGLNGKAQIDLELFGRASRTLLGVDVLREDRDGTDVFTLAGGPPGDPTRRRNRKETVGAYLQQEIELTDWLLLSGGVRHDRASYDIRDTDQGFGTKMVFDPTHTVWSPRVSLLARVTDTLSTYASYSRGFRFPNLSEVSGVFFASPEISPQKSRSVELGVKHESRRVRTSLALYRMDVKDEIVQNSSLALFGGIGVTTMNLDRVRHQGIEASWTVEVLPGIDFHGSYTWDDTRIRRDSASNLDGKRVPITPRHRANVGVLARLPFDLEVGGDIVFVGRRYGINDFNHDFDMLDPHRRFDFHVGWRPSFGEHLELALTFDVQNLSNRRYTEWGGRRTFSAEQAFFPAPERQYVGAVAVTLRR